MSMNADLQISRYTEQGGSNGEKEEPGLWSTEDRLLLSYTESIYRRNIECAFLQANFI